MRVYRDTRFSRDKTPYKTNIGIQFRHERGKDVHAPGFYVHIEPRACFLGAGIWHPETAALQHIRAAIAESPEQWRKASRGKRFTDNFALTGSSLQRPPRGYEADAPYVEDLKRKDFIGIAGIRDADVKSATFVRLASDHFRRAAPLMKFLCAALELEF